MTLVRTLLHVTYGCLFMVTMTYSGQSTGPENSFRKSYGTKNQFNVAGIEISKSITRFTSNHQLFTNYLMDDLLRDIKDVRSSMC